MDPIKANIFASEVIYQCELILVANDAIDHFLGLDDKMAGMRPTFYHVQTLLSGIAGVSKTLWSTDVNGKPSKARIERQPLRDHFNVTDISPFASHGPVGRTMRNHFEHFDERLDKWWNLASGVLINNGFFSGPVSSLINIPNPEQSILRGFDPVNKTILFMGEALAIADVLPEAIRLRSVGAFPIPRPTRRSL